MVSRPSETVVGTESPTSIKLSEELTEFTFSKKNSRKRKRNTHLWKKTKAALVRQKGESYVSQTGKVIPAKSVCKGTLCNDVCPYQCSVKFSISDRTTILSHFYSLDVNAKNCLLFKSIYMNNIKRQSKAANKHRTVSYKYFVTFNGQNKNVCKKAMCSFYGVGRKKLDIIKSNISKGLTASLQDKRGQHNSRPHKIKDAVKDYVMEHIKCFPAESSHYSRNHNPNRKYLSPLLNISKMHALYLLQCKETNQQDEYLVKESTYRNIFNDEFNLSFLQPRSDTCSTCDSGNKNEEHVENFTAAFNLLKYDREYAKTSENTAFITIDLQQTMPLPKLTTSKSFYLRQLWFYNFGLNIIQKNVEIATFCTWTEDVANRGSAEVFGSLLTAIEQDDVLKSKDHLIVWSDSCSGQNKNFTLICLYQYLILKGILRQLNTNSLKWGTRILILTLIVFFWEN